MKRGKRGAGFATHTTPNCVKCKCVHCIQQGKREKREKESEWGVRTAGASCGKREREGGCHKHLRHVASASWKLMLQTGGFFGQQQKNIKAPFKGLAGSSLLEEVGGDGEREGGPINNLPSQKCTEHETGWGEGADRENYGHYVIKYLKCCRRMPMEKDSVPEILPTATTTERAYVLTKEL